MCTTISAGYVISDHSSYFFVMRFSMRKIRYLMIKFNIHAQLCPLQNAYYMNVVMWGIESRGPYVLCMGGDVW